MQAHKTLEKHNPKTKEFMLLALGYWLLALGALGSLGSLAPLALLLPMFPPQPCGLADPTCNRLIDCSSEHKLTQPDAGLDTANMEWKL